MNDFIYYSPTKVYFGKDTAEKAGECVKAFGGSRVLIHYGSDRVVESGLMAKIEKSLDDACIQHVSLGGAAPNPRISLVREGAALAVRENVDFILAVGGGSAIDSAKGIALAAVNDCDIWDIIMRKTTPAGMLPTGNILTIAASGSEFSRFIVLTNEDGWVKQGFNHEMLRPAFTIMDPQLMYTLPPYQTASGITDIMMHTIERYFLPGGGGELTDCIAEELLRITIRYGRQCLEEPENYQARSEVMWAGSLSHDDLTGLGRSGSLACHALEHVLSTKYDVAHGAGLAAIWASWARAVYRTDVMRFARYSVKVWDIPMNYEEPEKTALEGIKATEDYFKSIGMPVSLTQLLGSEIPDEDIGTLADRCTKNGTATVGDYCPLNRDQIVEIYRKAK